MAEHAPGPWSIRGGPPLWYLIEDRDGCHVACVDVPAAAPLVAAAPELLEALRFVLAHAFEAKWAGDERALELVEAAIAKAEGRADG